MLASRSDSKFHVVVAKTKPSESLNYSSYTPFIINGLNALMFNLKEDVGGLQLGGEDIEIVDSTST
jgi:hypothetical protein